MQVISEGVEEEQLTQSHSTKHRPIPAPLALPLPYVPDNWCASCHRGQRPFPGTLAPEGG